MKTKMMTNSRKHTFALPRRGRRIDTGVLRGAAESTGMFYFSLGGMVMPLAHKG